MAWFGAHIIVSIAFKDGPQDSYPVWENIVLIEADSEEAAQAKAEGYGREAEGDSDNSLRWGGRPATSVFAGVRKLVRCDSDPERPQSGTEITYSDIVLDSLEAVRDLAAGHRVALREYE